MRVQLHTVGGVAGIATPLLMWAAFVVAAPSRAGYDVLRDPTSELGETGSPDAAAFNLAFFLVPGLLIMCFGAALAGIPGRRWARLMASLMVSLSGLSVLASGVIPMAANSETATFWHRVAGLPLLTVLPAGVLLLSLVFSAQSSLRAYRWLSLVAGCLLAILITCYQLGVGPIPDGAFQRAALAVLTPWLLAIGLLLLRLNAPHRPETA